MELRQLKTFQTVGRLMSFNRAAGILNYAQSTVSTQIKLLEEEFGIPLFNRLGKNIHLTEAGQMLMHYSQKMLDIEKETVSKLAGWEEPQGTISIRIPQSITTYFLPNVIRQFQHRFPGIGFDISTCAYDTLVHELKTGTTDLAFLLADGIPFSELKAELLRVEPLVVVAGEDHRLSGRAAMTIHDLQGQTILLPKHDCSYKMIFEQMLTEEKVQSVVFMQLNSIEAIKECVLKGVGVAMLPVLTVEEAVAQNKLIILPWPEQQLETAVLMIRHKDKWLSPPLKAFMGMVKDIVR